MRFLVVVLLSAAALAAQAAFTRPPVLIVPGLVSSAFESAPNPNTKDEDWERLWINPLKIIHEKEIFHTLTLKYDPKTRMFSNQTGIEIRPIGFGTIYGIDYMTREFGMPIPETDLYEVFLQVLAKEGNYTLNTNVRAAPWDWRMAGNHKQMEYFWTRVDQQIVELYNLQQRKVTIVCHCFGCPSTALHLSQKSQEWKEKYIGGFVNMAPSFQGSIDMLRGVLVGHDEGFEIMGYSLLELEYVRDFLRSTGTAGALLPQKSLVGDDPIAIFPSKTYYLKDMIDLLKLAGCNTTIDIYNQTREYEEIKAPGVPVTCILGTGIDTPIQLTFPTDQMSSEKKFLPKNSKMGSGDGTVPATALNVCKRWQKEQTQKVDYKEWEGMTHRNFVKGKDVARFLLANVLV